MAYYENYSMLQKQIEMFSSYNADIKKYIEAVIVDDGSPTAPARFESDPGFPMSLYRMKKDIAWNQDACRNLAASQAKGDWLLMTDMDHMIPESTIRHAISGNLNPAYIYTFARVTAPEMEPYKPHPNSYLMTKVLYEKIGGYDERFAGYYGSDGDFSTRARLKCNGFEALPLPLIRVPRSYIPDASTTTLTRKTPEDREMIRQIKLQRANQPPLRGLTEWERVV